MSSEEKFTTKNRWISFMGNELRIMGEIDGYYMLRYKGSTPFIKSVKEFPEFLKFIAAKKIK